MQSARANECNHEIKSSRLTIRRAIASNLCSGVPFPALCSRQDVLLLTLGGIVGPVPILCLSLSGFSVEQSPPIDALRIGSGEDSALVIRPAFVVYSLCAEMRPRNLRHPPRITPSICADLNRGTSLLTRRPDHRDRALHFERKYTFRMTSEEPADESHSTGDCQRLRTSLAQLD